MRTIALVFSMAAGVAVAQQADVKAFIPLLKPSSSVGPQYPAAALAEGKFERVDLLVTIDPQGAVTNVEVLSGGELFRQPAVDAVKQWVFHPVIRSGSPVFALANESVNFIPPQDSGAVRSAPVFKESEQRAIARRLGDLTRQYPRSEDQVLAALEQADAGDTGLIRFSDLTELAKAAIRAGDLDKAQAYANELLAAAPDHSSHWNYGNAIHDGNMVLGLVALRRGNTESAKRFLLEAGKTTGSPQLNSFGPNVTLAKELLEKNERDVVEEYFSQCGQFWKRGSKKLEAWTATVRGGGIPNFGANLVF